MRELLCSEAIRGYQVKVKSSKVVRACTIRLLTLGPAKHEKEAIYVVNQRIRMFEIAGAALQRSNSWISSQGQNRVKRLKSVTVQLMNGKTELLQCERKVRRIISMRRTPKENINQSFINLIRKAHGLIENSRILRSIVIPRIRWELYLETAGK